MIKWMRRLNEALPMLVLGIVIFSVLVELIGVWFVSDKLRYTTGLFIGMGLAIFLAVNNFPSFPGLFCLNKIGPPSLHLTIIPKGM